jgi:arylsulfatase A
MPVCHPSRQTIMTGQYPFRHPTAWGSWPEGVATFGHVLKRAGYATAVAGKWQLVLQKNNPTHPAQLGFDESAVFGWHEGPRFHNPMIYRNGVVWEEKRKPDVYGPEVYTEFLIDFMARNKDRPFFAYYPMALCHEISNDLSRCRHLDRTADTGVSRRWSTTWMPPWGASWMRLTGWAFAGKP